MSHRKKPIHIAASTKQSKQFVQTEYIGDLIHDPKKREWYTFASNTFGQVDIRWKRRFFIIDEIIVELGGARAPGSEVVVDPYFGAEFGRHT